MRAKAQLAAVAIVLSGFLAFGAGPASALGLSINLLGLNVSLGSTSVSKPKIYDSPESARTCENPAIEQPFASFGDNRDYVLAADGAFEDATLPGWQLKGGPRVADGNEPYFVRSAGDRRSLHLPAGSSAISPSMCVDLNYPTFRLFARALGLSPGRLKVDVVYPDVRDADWTTVAQHGPRSDWFLTGDMPLTPGLGGSEAGPRRVALRYTATGLAGSWKVDDVYIDPRRLH